MQKPKTISISKIRQFEACPRCYYYHYQLGIDFPEPEYFKYGKKVHNALEHWLKEGKLGGDFARQFVEVYKQRYTKEHTLIEHFFELPIIHPYTGEILEGTILNGRVDLVKDEYVIDHKTAANKWPEGKQHEDMQATFYSYFL